MLKVCDIQQFIKRVEVLDEIICYGAGQEMIAFAKLFADTAVMDKCSYIIDRDVEKQGKIIQYDKKKFVIVSPDKLKFNSNKRCEIVITCVKYNEILNDFENSDIFSKFDYYCLQYFKMFEYGKKALTKKLPVNIKLYKEEIIPKVIHYCWFGNTPIPDNYKKWMETWKHFCPDYEIIEWNESNYDINKNKYMKQAYDNRKWGFVPDYARLDIIYQYGGIYLDTDIELIANLDDLLYQTGFICFELETRINCGMGFGAIKGLDIIREMRDDYDKRSFLKQNGELDLTPSPDIQTSFFIKKGIKLNGEYQIVDGLTVFPEKLMGGKNWVTRKIDLLPYTKAIHHFDGSWLDTKLKTEIYRQEQGIRLAEKDLIMLNL